MRRHRKLIFTTALVVLLILGAVGYIWLTNLADPMPEAELALESGEAVAVETDLWITFTPAEPSATGFIFYSGGRVEAEQEGDGVATISREKQQVQVVAATVELLELVDGS